MFINFGRQLPSSSGLKILFTSDLIGWRNVLSSANGATFRLSQPLNQSLEIYFFILFAITLFQAVHVFTAGRLSGIGHFCIEITLALGVALIGSRFFRVRLAPVLFAQTSSLRERGERKSNFKMSHDFEDELNQLKKRENRFYLAAHFSQIGIWELEISTGRLSRSEIFDRLFGYQKALSEWTLKSLLAHVHPSDRDRAEFQMKRAMGENGKLQLETRIIWPDEQIRWIALRGVATGDPASSHPRPTRLVGTVWDVSERKMAEESRTQLFRLSRLDLQKLKEERKLRDQFVATLTHDLRNPLCAAKLNAQLLTRSSEPGSERYKKVVNRIVQNIERVDTMIQDLLDANRIQAGQNPPLHVGPCELRALIEEAAEDLSVNHGDRFRIVADSEISGFWCRLALRRIVDNLAINAAKYGAADKMVTFFLESCDEKVQIAVHNEGNPLSSDEQKRIFEPFQRSFSAEQGSQKGWGLGLTVVRGLAEAHGGQVRVLSEPNRGTTFTVEIPRDARPYGRTLGKE